MSKSLRRVQSALQEAGLSVEIRETDDSARTAEGAAAAVGCTVDQIAKSIIFRGEDTGHVVLFLTAGGNRVDAGKAAALAGEPLSRAGIEVVRQVTGFAIGGVAPLGHLTPLPAFLDPRLLDFAEVWAAAGTPRHMFCANPQSLQRAAWATRADFTA